MTTNLAERDTAVDDVATPATTVDEATTTAAEQRQYPYIEYKIDPRDLRADGNSRVVGDIRQKKPELVASVAKRGLDPMVSIVNVAPGPDGVLEVQVGFHRTAAAVAVKEVENPDLTIPVMVHAPGTTRETLIAQIIENLHREDYTQAEEAKVYEQLALTGLDDDAIADELSKPVERIKAGRVVAASPRTIQAANELLPETDLLVLAQLKEFEDNDEDYLTVVRCLRENPGNFEWKLGQVREDRRQRALRAEEEQRLIDLGYAIVEKSWDRPAGSALLEDLCTGEDQTPLDPADHTDCPGRGAAVRLLYGRELDITELCMDYAKYGHHTRASVQIAAAETQLRADGITIADPDAEGVAKLWNLFADGQAEKSLTPEEHAGCPGHAAYAEDDLDQPAADIVYVCTDPDAHGHVRRGGAQVEPDRAYKAAEVKRAGKNNEAWRKAKEERRAWLVKFFTGWSKRKAADLPKRVHHWLALAEVLASDFLSDAAPKHSYACQLLKIAEPKGNSRAANPLVTKLRQKNCTETQAVLIRLAQVIGACEEHWNRAYTENADASWRSPSEDTKFYFELLEALEFPLSPVERLVNNPELDHAEWPHLAPAAETADGATGAQNDDASEAEAA
ncbi:ParB/RepB/Spo0J family partition protein [Amycolatopsis roodepoortensis]|uniref:ParB/RepB/Spo0J family partition protein n=1 Tax=Amycolatopsis roodepoortensis TaxID=700274 RepID=UPI00214B48A8|nr:ParB/RepB/Spo0J family partition protein [Amycolatopsis roodepoortensis]UUV32165.1 ParB/RepB/Spo0J family partition protein [Amycolatopsis roodepoortensis]